MSSILQLIDNFPDPAGPPLFKLRTVSPGQVVQVLKSLRSDSSTSPVQIPVKFLKMVAEIIAGPITEITNNCTRKYYIPLIWKKAGINPIPETDYPKTEHSGL